MNNRNPVFYDPNGRRWKYFLALIGVMIFLVAFILTYLVRQILITPKLSPIKLAPTEKGEVFAVKGDSWIMTRWGAKNPKEIALTFDDGPDKRNSNKILDILKAHNVKGTFFVVGANANDQPNILNRMFVEGHEIGNHTYTHLNAENASESRVKFELNAALRLIEARLGIRTRLFRAPYSDDHESVTIQELRPIKVSTELGYLNVGMKVDPKDWKINSTEELVNTTLNYIYEGRGNIVLLHDGGEDRQKTIEALPEIIFNLKSKGYSFVTVSELIGLDSPYDKVPDDFANRANDFLILLGFNFFRYLYNLVNALAIITIIFGVARFILVGVFAIVDNKAKKHKKFDHSYLPKVAAIVPAHNEANVVSKTLGSLISSNYPNLEIIAVDDGSSDNTFAVMQKFTKYNNVKVFKIKNAGKSEATNFGLNQTEANIIVSIDADTIMQRDTITRLVPHFKDSNIGAVAGNVKVGNRLNLLTNLQAIEYITSQNLERRAFAVFNSIRVVPGVIGTWRKDVIIKAGGFTDDTLAEDTDLTLRILRLGYKVDFEANAIVLTEAPQNIEGFMKQRFRWMHGTFQAIWKHIDTLFKPKFGKIGTVIIPDIILFQIIFPLLAPLMDFFLVFNVTTTIFSILDHPTNYSTLALRQALFYYSIFMIFDYGAALLSFMMDKKESKKLFLYIFFQRFFYRQLLYVAAINSTLAAIRGKKQGWKKIKRHSTVPTELTYS